MRKRVVVCGVSAGESGKPEIDANRRVSLMNKSVNAIISTRRVLKRGRCAHNLLETVPRVKSQSRYV
jgi:hypothetical protein